MIRYRPFPGIAKEAGTGDGPRLSMAVAKAAPNRGHGGVATKAKAAGFATATLKEKGQLKVRLTATADRPAMDATAEKLKKAGFKPFAVKVE